jgi:hypothetical protein
MKKTFKDYYPFPLRIDEIIPFKAWCAGERMSMAYDVLIPNLVPTLYQELLEIINGTRPYNDSEQWGKPDKFVSKGCHIFAEGSDKPVIRVRGWGKLTGLGGFKLTEDEAVKIQDEFVAYILEKLNNKKPKEEEK